MTERVACGVFMRSVQHSMVEHVRILLERTRRDGDVDDYAGTRISKTGKRFRFERAIAWNVADAAGVRRGQATTFDRRTTLSVVAPGEASIMRSTPEDKP